MNPLTQDVTEPIMSSRGRKAPGKKSKKGSNTVRKAPSMAIEGSPVLEPKAAGPRLGSSTSINNLKADFRRADSDAPLDSNLNRLSTPPLGGAGALSPALVNGFTGGTNATSQADSTELDGAAPLINGGGAPLGPTPLTEEDVYEDFEFKTWKQVTKRDRALVAAERHRLFKGNRISKDEPALRRTKAGMRRWQRQHRLSMAVNCGLECDDVEAIKESTETAPAGETLAEGMEGEEDRVLPDYYDTMSAIPEVSPHLQWIEDADGQLRPQSESNLHLVPRESFTAPVSTLSQKMDANMRQMQETRKICSKISRIKQMQQQTQVRSNNARVAGKRSVLWSHSADERYLAVSKSIPELRPGAVC